MKNILKSICSIFAKKDEIGKTLIQIGVVLISIPVLSVVVTSILFLFKISITNLNFYLAIALTAIINLFLSRSLWKNAKKGKRAFITVCVLLISTIIFFFSLFIANSFHDTTYDGNTYHKSAIGNLKDGWNPNYANLDEFNSKNANSIFELSERKAVWSNNYPKASWYYSATIYSVTDDIESGKSINWLLMFGLLFMITGYMLKQKSNYLFAFIIGLLMAMNAIFVSQCFTFYVDSLLGSYLFLIIFALFLFCSKDDGLSKWIKYYIYISSMIMLINIKFTGLAYAGIFCLAYYIYFVILAHKNKECKKRLMQFTLISFISLLFSVFIVGINTYCKNFIDKGHPFWPIYGENKIEIILQNQPYYFKDKSGIEKFIIANFSKTENISQASKEEAEWKVPFTVDKKEIYSLTNVDIRIGGYGVFFGGILILSIIAIAVSAPKMYKTNHRFFWPLIIPIIVIFILSITLTEIWWARYFPQLYLVPIISIFMVKLAFDNKILKNSIIFAIIFFLLLNNALNLKYNINNTIKNQEDINYVYSYFLQTISTDDTVELYFPTLYSSAYNVLDFMKVNNYKNIDVINKKIDYVKYGDDKKVYYFEKGYTIGYIKKQEGNSR